MHTLGRKYLELSDALNNYISYLSYCLHAHAAGSNDGGKSSYGHGTNKIHSDLLKSSNVQNTIQKNSSEIITLIDSDIFLKGLFQVLFFIRMDN